MPSLWFWTPLLWKALRFIVLFNYGILSSVIHCDSVTGSTWLGRDRPDWITGRRDPSEPRACEPRRSTSSLRRAPRTHPAGAWSSFHLLSPLLPGTACSPTLTIPEMVSSMTLPLTEAHKPVLVSAPGSGTARRCRGRALSQKQHQHRADTTPTPCALGPWWHWTCTHPPLGCGSCPQEKVQQRCAMATLAPRMGWESWDFRHRCTCSFLASKGKGGDVPSRDSKAVGGLF